MSEDSSIEYSALTPFANPDFERGFFPAVFGAPGRYVQGEGVIDEAGHYLRRLGFSSVLVLMSLRSQGAEGARLLQSLDDAGLAAQILTFGGECSFEEIDKHVAAASASKSAPDGLVAIGGGKAVDAGKSIAHRLKLPCAVVPSLASNDAPCAAVSVIYSEEGVTLDAEIYDQSPVLVLMDTGVVAEAGARYLVAGMGDAMATWYEARACAANPQGITTFVGRPSLAGGAVARLCADTLFEHGLAAKAAVQASSVTPALENIVEANTLLSGLGYESGGLAAAHAYAQGFTTVERVHRQYLHGEMVAIGTLAQLLLEDDEAEAAKVARFFAEVGLPVHLRQIGLSADDTEDLQSVVQGALAFPFLGNLVASTTQESLLQGLLQLDQLGRRWATEHGDEAYRELHA